MWAILGDLAAALGAELGTGSSALLTKEISAVAPAYAGVSLDRFLLPGGPGIVVPGPDGSQPIDYEPRTAEPEQANGGFALHTARTLYDDGVMVRNSPGIAALASAPRLHLHPDDAKAMGVSTGDRLTVTVDGSAEVRAVIDDSLSAGTVYLPFNQPGTAGLGGAGQVIVEVAT